MPPADETGICWVRPDLSGRTLSLLRGLWGCSGRTMAADRCPEQLHCQRVLSPTNRASDRFFRFHSNRCPRFRRLLYLFFVIARRFLPAPDVQSLEQELGKEYL